MRFRRKFTLTLIPMIWLASSCALLDDSSQKKTSPSGLIATPASYYSTQKARYLGTRYKENLDRLAARIVKDPKTAPLQFANNISSVGGIGFFTHSATKSPDERYLEVVLATPETFETKDGYSEKVAQLFARYGAELLSILGSDKEIYQDKQLSGYGLNLAWRTVVAEGVGNRVAMARAVAYFPKERVLNFLHQEINANDLLANAVIFAVEEDGPLQLVSYQPHQSNPDYRPAIREDNLATAPVGTKPTQTVVTNKPVTEMKPKAEPSAETAKRTPAANNESSTNARTEKPATKSAAIAKATVAEPKDQRVLQRSPESVAKPIPTAVSSRDGDNSEKLALTQKKESVALPVAAKAPLPEEAKGDDKATPIIPPTNKPTIAPAKPAVDATEEDQAVVTVVTKRSQEAPPNTAELKPDHGTEFEQAATVVAPPSQVKPLISTNVSEKAVVAVPVAKLESREVSAKQPAALSSEASGSSAPMEKNLPAPTPASKPTPSPVTAALPAPKQLERENTGAPVPVTRATPNASAPVPQSVKLPEIKKSEPSTVAQSVVKPSEPVLTSKAAKAPPAVSTAKNEPPSNKPAAVQAPVQEKTIAKPVPEQLASLKIPQEVTIDNKSMARPVPRPLEGFIIQIAFNDKEKAQSWAEKMENRGYAVSVTAAGSEGALRVRLGNFAVRDEAERQLNNLKSDGMKGIIINLPQAFRPEVRSSLP
jgi:DedD protein